MGVLSHAVTEAGFCVECEKPIEPFEGPAAPWRFNFFVREIAAALIGMGSGSSYTSVAETARSQAWGPGRKWNRSEGTVVNGALVAEWLQQYGPIVSEPYQETGWPETLVLDSTTFLHTDSWTGVQARLFSVLFAYGYPADGTKPRLWKIASSLSDTGQDWAYFLAKLPGKPQVIVCDDDTNIKLGIRTHWGQGRPVHVHTCEHHLYLRAKKALETDGAPRTSPLHKALNKAFKSPEGWDVLRDEVRLAGSPTLKKWMTSKSAMVTAQLARRGEVSVYANGAIEAPIRVIRENIERRAWCFRNRVRMDLLLDLMRLNINKVASQDIYSTAIREHLKANGGRPTTTRKQWDPLGTSSLRR